MTRMPAEFAMPQVEVAYEQGLADGLEMKYPGETRANIIQQVMSELDTSGHMTQELMIETALGRAMELYLLNLKKTPDLRPEVQRDTYPGLLAGNGYSPIVEHEIAAFRDRVQPTAAQKAIEAMQ